MIARRRIHLCSAYLVAWIATSATVFAQDAHDRGAVYTKCAQACGDCQRQCDACARHCADMLADGMKEHITTLRTCQDCADFCTAAAQIVARQGAFSNLICQSCADACARCGKECDKFIGDKTMADCAKACRDCEKACRAMVKLG